MEFEDQRLPRRFWDKAVLYPDGCWVWTAALNNEGYAAFTMGGRSLAHRIAYEELVGPIPEGMVLDHVCRTRSCVNPAHLEPVTQSENLLRGNTANARKSAQLSCIHGHEFTDENTYIKPNGTRACRECDRTRSREYQRRRRHERNTR